MTPNDPERPSLTPADASERPRSNEQQTPMRITVTRTGGIAGLRRTWRAQPDTADTPDWVALLEGCPWEAADPARSIAPDGADRYMWHVDARCGEAAREAALADPEVTGPWRALIDAVKSAPPR